MRKVHIEMFTEGEWHLVGTLNEGDPPGSMTDWQGEDKITLVFGFFGVHRPDPSPKTEWMRPLVIATRPDVDIPEGDMRTLVIEGGIEQANLTGGPYERNVHGTIGPVRVRWSLQEVSDE